MNNPSDHRLNLIRDVADLAVRRSVKDPVLRGYLDIIFHSIVESIRENGGSIITNPKDGEILGIVFREPSEVRM